MSVHCNSMATQPSPPRKPRQSNLPRPQRQHAADVTVTIYPTPAVTRPRYSSRQSADSSPSRASDGNAPRQGSVRASATRTSRPSSRRRSTGNAGTRSNARVTNAAVRSARVCEPTTPDMKNADEHDAFSFGSIIAKHIITDNVGHHGFIGGAREGAKSYWVTGDNTMFGIVDPTPISNSNVEKITTRATHGDDNAWAAIMGKFMALQYSKMCVSRLANAYVYGFATGILSDKLGIQFLETLKNIISYDARRRPSPPRGPPTNGRRPR